MDLKTSGKFLWRVHSTGSSRDNKDTTSKDACNKMKEENS